MLKEYLTNIANAIRSKLGGADKINAQDFADKVNEVYDKGVYRTFVQNCENYHGTTLNIPYGVKKIRQSCFQGFTGMFHVNVPDTVTDIGNSAFRDCTNLLEFTFPPNLTNFSYSYVFADEKNLHTVTFTNGLKFQIHSVTFNNCTALKNVYVLGGEFESNVFFASSPLSPQSMKNIILHLKNYKGTDSEFVYTVRFTNACWSALEADGTLAPGGMAWKDYVYALGWNI